MPPSTASWPSKAPRQAQPLRRGLPEERRRQGRGHPPPARSGPRRRPRRHRRPAATLPLRLAAGSGGIRVRGEVMPQTFWSDIASRGRYFPGDRHVPIIKNAARNADRRPVVADRLSARQPAPCGRPIPDCVRPVLGYEAGRGSPYKGLLERDRRRTGEGDGGLRSPTSCAATPLWEKEQVDAALADYTKGLQIYPTIAIGYIMRADLRRARAELDHAIADYEQALRIEPKNVRALFGRAKVWIRKESYDRARSPITPRSFVLISKGAGAYLGRALAWMKKKNYDRAIDDYNEVIRLDPENALALASRAVMWKKKDSIDRSVADARALIRLCPDLKTGEIQSENFRCVSLFVMGPYGFELDDDHYSGGFRFSYGPNFGYSPLPKLIKLALLTDEVEVTSNRAVVLERRGQAWMAIDQYDRAISDFSEAIQLKPNLDGAYYARGSAYAARVITTAPLPTMTRR